MFTYKQRHNTGLTLSEEWKRVFEVLREDALQNAEIVKAIELKIAGNPYFLGKVALLDYLLSLVESDIAIFSRGENTASQSDKTE